MTDYSEKKKKANDLRKAGKLAEALTIYRELWVEPADMFDGAGLLHCLRKLAIFEEAIPLADKLLEKAPNFKWAKMEATWTYIQGILNKLTDKDPLQKVTGIAVKILSLDPDLPARRKAVNAVVKYAKAHGQWKTLNEWIVKLDPSQLSNVPMKNESGREGWSEQSVWFNYRIRGLIETGESENAIKMLDEIENQFPRQRKFFLRLRAMVFYRLADSSNDDKTHQISMLQKAEAIYLGLCSKPNADWWLLHEYGRVLRGLEKKEDALRTMCQAAQRNQKLQSLLQLLMDLGSLFEEKGEIKQALTHYVLCQHIRKNNKWPIPDSLSATITKQSGIIAESKDFKSMGKVLALCQSTWKTIAPLIARNNAVVTYNRAPRRGLQGKINLGSPDRHFCFIESPNRESFFVIKSDLPKNLLSGTLVHFDAIPSLDKKKKKESWKAVNIRVCLN